ncbi:MAG: hypothetical protein HYT03_01710 [Candidatus Harrisonbacteria bacterium]|nr:hypothetical protein [Candidatus Harrisonbacteria bacterium]
MAIYLCIDIGTTSIKAAEKDSTGRILKKAELRRLDGPFHTSIQPLNEREAANCLKTLLSRMESQSYWAAASLPAFNAFTTVAPTPDPKYIPAAPSLYKMDAIKLNDGRYFLLAVPREVILKYKRIFAAAGLRLARLEIESFPLARQFARSAEPTLIIDVGERSTTFTIASGGKAHFVSQSDFSLVSNAEDVIMEKARLLAEKKKIKRIITASSPFAVVNGL